MRVSNLWKDYECMDVGDGFKIERFGNYILKRPENSINDTLQITDIKLDGYHSGDMWQHTSLPDTWTMEYQDMKFMLKLHEFKHIGIFPEQASNWDFIRKMGKQHKPKRILNLFGYTGAATIAAAMEDVDEVVHIDALKSAIERTRLNISLNSLDHKLIRTIQEDVMKFLVREKKRGRTYHAIIMDPPTFGRGPKGSMWKIEDDLEPLIDACLDILDKDASYIILNTYSPKLSANDVEMILKKRLKQHNIKGFVDSQDIALPITQKPYTLKQGKTTRWSAHENTL